MLDSQMMVAADRNRIITYTGRTINPMNPKPEDISIVDIAHSLSNQCRFTGHTSEFYSVAQHSVLVTNMVPDKDKLWGLLHDASEAYLADLARPIKRDYGDLADAYSAAERRLMHAVALRFDLALDGFSTDKHGVPDAVKEADNLVLKAEMLNLMPASCTVGIESDEESDFEITPWSPKNAKTNFLIMFAELTDNDMMIY